MALNRRQRQFAEEYLIDRNATQAAIRAGYSEKTAYSQGSRLLKNVEVQKIHEERFAETIMSANEAMYLLSEHARGNLGDFIGLSQDELANHSKSSLIKKFKIKSVTRTDKDGESEVEDTIYIELYDAQSAIKEIIRIHRLDNGQATDNIQVVVKTGMDTDEL